MIKQVYWRSAAAVALLLCGTMAFLGSKWDVFRMYLRQSPGLFLGYWSLVFVCLLVAVYIALIDIRYIRLKYHAEKKVIFRETLGDEVLRKAIREAIKQRHAEMEKSRRN